MPARGYDEVMSGLQGEEVPDDFAEAIKVDFEKSYRKDFGECAEDAQDIDK